MPEYIEREALLQVLEELGGWDDPPDLWAEGYAWGTFSALRRVEDQPTADVVEVRHGKWVEDEYNETVYCSECKEEALYKSIFEEQFDYDWEKNLIPYGYEEHREYIKTKYL